MAAVSLKRCSVSPRFSSDLFLVIIDPTHLLPPRPRGFHSIISTTASVTVGENAPGPGLCLGQESAKGG